MYIINTTIMTDLPAFCASTVPADADKSLAQLYACKDASKCFLDITLKNKEITEYNKIQADKLRAALAEYNSRLAAHNSRYRQWENREGDFARFKKENGQNNEFWSRDHPQPRCWGNQDYTDAVGWCKWGADQLGLDGNNYQPKSWDNNCGQWWDNNRVTVMCYKPNEIVLRQQNDYQNAKPHFNENAPTQADFPLKQQITNNTNIQCCSNYMGGNATFTGNAQECNQSILQQIKNIETSPVVSPTVSPVVSPTVSPVVSPTVSPTVSPVVPINQNVEILAPVITKPPVSIKPKENPEDIKRKNLIIASIISIILLIFSSIVAVLIVI